MWWGWMEIFKSSDQEHYRRTEQLLIDNQIRYRIYALNHATKAFVVGSQMANQSLSRGPSFSPGGLYQQYAESQDEPVYTIEIRRRDLKRYRMAR
jgi:hypothetical protein